jgi:hypothetical protein
VKRGFTPRGGLSRTIYPQAASGMTAQQRGWMAVVNPTMLADHPAAKKTIRERRPYGT